MQQTISLVDFAFESGETLPRVALGIETYGTLNQRGDNVVLLAPFLAGHSHAAGRFTPDDPAPGWWDGLIGPGRAIDTDVWFVVSTDVFALPRSKPPFVVTAGPHSNDERGAVYGPDFPAVSIADQVEAQRRILEQLGVTHLEAAMGASMGGMIAWQWGAQYPDFVDTIVPVAAPAWYAQEERAGLAFARLLIENDPDYQDGRYYGTGREPNLGVGLVAMMLNSLVGPDPFKALEDFDWASLPERFAELMDLDPQEIADAVPNLETYVARAKEEFDGNHFVYTLRLFEAYDIPSALTAASQGVEVLAIGFADDQLVTPEHLFEVGEEIGDGVLDHQLHILDGGHGHLSCLLDLDQLDPIVRSVLAG